VTDWLTVRTTFTTKIPLLYQRFPGLFDPVNTLGSCGLGCWMSVTVDVTIVCLSKWVSGSARTEKVIIPG